MDDVGADGSKTILQKKKTKQGLYSSGTREESDADSHKLSNEL